ncbi:winged helix-turn-helix domain-containing protein [Streptomyces lavendulocolor]
MSDGLWPVQTAIHRRLRLALSVATVWTLLKRHGWVLAAPAPARRALERGEHAVELWKKVWPRVGVPLVDPPADLHLGVGNGPRDPGPGLTSRVHQEI